MASPPSPLRALIPDLPRSVWTLEAGTLVNFFGSGIAFPFLLLYLHNVRSIDLSTAGLVVASMGAVGVTVGPAAGPVIDRAGARPTLALALVVSALGYGLLPLVYATWQAFLVAAAIGVGTATFWPSVSVLLTGLVRPEQRHTTFALQRVALNLGVGLGGVVGGLVAATEETGSFTVLFAVDAATFLAMAALLPLVPEPPPQVGKGAEEGYGAVVRDRLFLSLLGLNVVFIAAGYAPLELLPVLAKNETAVSERWIGVIFLANTLTLVLAQLPVAKLLEGRRRMRALAVMPAGLAVAWLVVLAGAAGLESTAAALVLVAAASLFGFATCFHGPTQAALVADLAPARLRGRYLALASASWEIGFVVGPAVGGAVLDALPLLLWPAAAGACLLAAAWTLALERSLPPALLRTPTSAPTPAGATMAE